MRISARFIGTNSLGYIHGEKYELTVSDDYVVWVKRADGSGFCPYSSLKTFLQNWAEIKNI